MSQRYRSTFRGYLIDHHSPAPPAVTLERLDVREYREFYRTARISNLMVYCKDHWGYSYYDTRIGTRHPALAGDWVAEVAKELRGEAIEFNAYYCLEYDSLAPAEHPEWSIVDPAGVPVRLAGRMARWGMPCYLTPYRDYVLGQLREIVDGYRPDSLFLDIFGKTLCYCTNCRAAFAARFGYDLPVARGENVDEYQSFDFGPSGRDVNRFLEECASSMLDDVIAAVKAIDPQIAVTINFAALYPRSIRDKLDYQFTEPWAGNWLSAAYSRDTARGQFPQLGPGDVSEVYNYRPQSVYTLAAAQIAAAGCRVFFYSGSQHVDGTLEHEEARRIGEAYREVEALEPYLGDRELIADVAILQSESSIAANAGSHVIANAIGRCKRPDPHRKAVLGAMQCCDQAGVTWTVLPEQDAALDTLSRFRLVVLAGVYHVSDELGEALRSYVAAGGCVVADGACGLSLPDGSRAADFPLADLLGCSYERTVDEYSAAEWGGYVRAVRTDGTSAPAVHAARFWDATPDTFLPAGRVQYAVRATGALVLGELFPPTVPLTETSWVNWWCPPPRADASGVTPAVLATRSGAGRCLYFAWDFFAGRADGLELNQGVFDGVISELLPDPAIRLRTDLPRTVGFAAYRRGSQLIVHVLSHLAERSGGDAPPVAPGALVIDRRRLPVTAACLVTTHAPGRSDLAVEATGDRLEIRLPDVTIHYVVVATLG